MDTRLLPASVEDIDDISRLAQIVWQQHYPAIISQPQIEYMLDLMYSDDSLLGQMRDKGHRYYFVDVDGTREGFLSVSGDGQGEWMLHKFYINQERAGMGIGTEALRQLFALLNPKAVRLTVNRQNYKSINFYFRNGFVIERVADFDIGGGYVMNDFVMVWKRAAKKYH